MKERIVLMQYLKIFYGYANWEILPNEQTAFFISSVLFNENWKRVIKEKAGSLISNTGCCKYDKGKGYIIHKFSTVNF